MLRRCKEGDSRLTFLKVTLEIMLFMGKVAQDQTEHKLHTRN